MESVTLKQFFPVSKAFFIANDKYLSPAIEDLESPSRDAFALKSVLESKHDFVVEPIACKSPHDSSESIPNPLINARSTDVLKFLENIQVGDNDRVIIYFACHGIAIDGDGSPKGYILASDASPGDWKSFIEMSDILQRIEKISCRHLLLILDCCYAGAFRWVQTTRGIGIDVPKSIYYERMEQYSLNKTWQVMTSSAHDQKAIDTLRLGAREGEIPGGLSPFAQVLVTALETGEADLSYGGSEPDGLITVTELNFYLQHKIFKNLFDHKIAPDKRQLPSLFSILNAKKEIVGKGEFLFQSPQKKKLQLKRKTNANPYKGLDNYQIDDNSIFYGRQRVIDGWIEGNSNYIGLIRASQQYHLIIVTGPSGIGKSSLVKAGLLAHYKGSRNIVELRPGKTPWSTNESIIQELKSTKNSILLVDQYEELVTVCNNDDERNKFEYAISNLLDENLIIATVRSDFERQFKESPLMKISGIADEKTKYRFVIPPFERNEIEEIVRQPATQELLEFKPIDNGPTAVGKFIDNIVDEGFQNSGSLPLLSLALSELWIERDNNNLLEKKYIHFGGIVGILDKKATKEYQKYQKDPEGQILFRQLFFRMTTFEGGRISKRRIYTNLESQNSTDSSEGDAQRATDELVLTVSNQTKKIKLIATDLVNARLLKADRDEAGRAFVEPSHDALLRSWEMMTIWLKQELHGLNGQGITELLKAVSDAAFSYEFGSKDYRKNSLKSWAEHPRLMEVKSNMTGVLNKTENAFIEKAFQQRTSARRTRNWSIGLAVGIITTLGIFGWIQAKRSETQAKRNLALYLSAESDKYGPTEKLSILKRAYETYQTL
ncbi:MAG: caspase family protein [Chryseolinea sp.]